MLLIKYSNMTEPPTSPSGEKAVVPFNQQKKKRLTSGWRGGESQSGRGDITDVLGANLLLVGTLWISYVV